MRKPLDRMLVLRVLFCLTVVQAIPAQGTWTPAAPLLTGRFLHGVAAGVDGRIYTAGGFNAGPLAVVEAYDPGSDQ